MHLSLCYKVIVIQVGMKVKGYLHRLSLDFTPTYEESPTSNLGAHSRRPYAAQFVGTKKLKTRMPKQICRI
jgi:hypothetical protein